MGAPFKEAFFYYAFILLQENNYIFISVFTLFDHVAIKQKTFP